ncbi:class I SAM-dependent methyltransferase [Chryseobacterium nematophagum]|uniref:Class I SAM-dependent methyltransferase n=1 Tax=Chryseobacterium nematophagum TaxID=2305228 RepID=A0A3M7LCP4_9FLAO|nr:class I SAM-dependent methyltransferase [Chryseobacterium nematophagum]RMZ60481.1 class I SAM-dependent methyltransferase [Chryseobacterium nematophagum]
MDKEILRSIIFKHLDGIVTTPIIASLLKKDIISFIINRKEASLSELTESFKANEGYLNVALRTLSSQGFLEYHVNNEKDEVIISSNTKTQYLQKYSPIYLKVIPFQKKSLDIRNQILENSFIEEFTQLADSLKNNFGLSLSKDEIEKSVQEQILKHIEGCIIGPIIVYLGMTGMFHKYFMETSFQAAEFHKNHSNFEVILDFLVHLNWFTKSGNNYKFTETGIYFAKRATSYGVTVSYLPLLNKMDELLFGNASKIREIDEGEDEIHVDRAMNVWGSGGAHSTYFKVANDFIIEIFNQPIHLQPKGVLDMGCGNGAFIQHIFETIERHTIRGKMLEEHPLFLVGADYNPAALKATRANLINSDIWAKVIWGDIGNPQKLAEDLKDNYEIDLSDLLNIRTFLDHNRIWTNPNNMTPDRVSTSTGAFASRGKRLPNNLVEESLKEHLELWLPYIKKNGLLLIELHSLQPELTSSNIGKTSATAYEATHGFSDQYILELEVFKKICLETGLSIDKNLSRKFPNSDLATVSINLLKV